MSSSRSDDWPTDPKVYARLDDEFGFTLDPCASHDNHKAPRYFTRDDNGLTQPWAGRVFMNPPYGRAIGAWMRKAWEASQTTAELVVCLVPARTDTRWWHEWAVRGEIRFLRGRLRFGDLSSPAPFPSAVVVFRNGGRVTKPLLGLVLRQPVADAGGRVVEHVEQRLALADREAEHPDSATVGVLKPVCERVVVEQAGELEELVVGNRDAGEEHGSSVHLFGRCG